MKTSNCSVYAALLAIASVASMAGLKVELSWSMCTAPRGACEFLQTELFRVEGAAAFGGGMGKSVVDHVRTSMARFEKQNKAGNPKKWICVPQPVLLPRNLLSTVGHVYGMPTARKPLTDELLIKGVSDKFPYLKLSSRAFSDGEEAQLPGPPDITHTVEIVYSMCSGARTGCVRFARSIHSAVDADAYELGAVDDSKVDMKAHIAATWAMDQVQYRIGDMPVNWRGFDADMPPMHLRFVNLDTCGRETELEPLIRLYPGFNDDHRFGYITYKITDHRTGVTQNSHYIDL